MRGTCVATNYNRRRYYTKSTTTLRNEEFDRQIRLRKDLDAFRRIAVALFNGDDLNEEDTALVMKATQQLCPETTTLDE